MSDIDTYLTELRSHLSDLDPKRADDIIAEARTHLQSRAAQFEATGMSHEGASAQAARSFGESAQVAADLLAGNSRHRRPMALRAVAALAISLGSLAALSTVINSAYFRESVLKGFMMPRTGLEFVAATDAVAYPVYVAAAVLTGVIAGRRFWWIASFPPLWAAGDYAYWVLLRPGATMSVGWGFVIGYCVRMAVHAAGFGGLGWLGAHLPARRSASVALKMLCVTVVAAPWLAAVGVIWGDWGRAGIRLSMMPVAGFLALLAGLLIAARHDNWLSREAFIGVVSTACGLGLLCAVGIALIYAGEGGSALREIRVVLSIAAVICAAGLFSILIYAARTRPAPAPSLSTGT